MMFRQINTLDGTELSQVCWLGRHVDKMSFIIPHKDDPLLSRLLGSLHKQSRREFEVIIVDSSEFVEGSAMFDRWNNSLRLKVVRAKCGRGTARNIGVKFAKSDVLVFVDADVVLPHDFAANLADLFDSNPGVAAVGFPIYPAKVNKVSRSFYRFLRFLDEASYHYGKPRIPTTCAAYRRSIFESRFFLDLVGEDVLFSADVNRFGKALFAKHIRVFEEPRRWDGSSNILKNLCHYVPAFVANFLIFFGLHRLIMPRQEAESTQG